ncbi:hypothetical protein [Paenibacillus terreus]|uniref:hypothetical protein n=1 Tax=Paenibacillus terreus TaxID=1387834 RepID=UPI0035CD2452
MADAELQAPICRHISSFANSGSVRCDGLHAIGGMAGPTVEEFSTPQQSPGSDQSALIEAAMSR